VTQPPGGGAGGVVSQPPGSNAGGVVNQPNVGGIFDATVTQGTTAGIPLKFVCATSEADLYIGTSVSKAASLEMIVSDSAGNVVCDKSVGVKEYITKNKALDLASCQLTGNSYTVRLENPAKPAHDLFFSVLLKSQAFFEDDYISIVRADANSAWTATSHISPIQEGYPMPNAQMFAANAVVGVLWANNPANDASVDASKCDSSASPLVVNMTPPGKADTGMQLSSPEKGVWFDILGRNSNPYAHAKKKISWIKNANYMFLALPRNGHVSGIDQLFGNNTFGEDYTFAENGFAALAKYDANGDRLINEKDPIYRSLRLWSDANFDGVAQPNELKSLSDYGLKEIDLGFDPTYFEQDQYGNQSRLRSTVKSENGQLHTIFDLWFVLK
jgi:hypothetical protein